jgi:hypothetical protein
MAAGRSLQLGMRRRPQKYVTYCLEMAIAEKLSSSGN